MKLGRTFGALNCCVLKRLPEAGLAAKSQFAMSECTYLGYIVGEGAVKPEVHQDLLITKDKGAGTLILIL